MTRAPHFPRLVGALLMALLAAIAAPAVAADVPAPVRQFLTKYCLTCHGPDEEKGDFRVDTLRISENKADAAYWELVLDNLHLGEMPPKKHPVQPTPADVEPITEWIAGELKRAKDALAGHGSEVVLRRLNRAEYQNTVADLFDVHADVTSTFPDDMLNHGFDGIGATLMLSAAQMDEYVKAADTVLTRVLSNTEKPKLGKATYTIHDLNRMTRKGADENLAMRHRKFANLTPYEQQKTRDAEKSRREDPSHGFEYPVWENGRVRLALPDENPKIDGLLYTNAYVGVTLATHKFLSIKHPGTYRIAVTAYPVMNNGKPVRLQLTSGKFRPGDPAPRIIDTIYLTKPDPQTFEYKVHLEPGERVEYTFLDAPRPVNRTDRPKLPGPFIAVRSAEIEGPLVEQWPPRGLTTIFGSNDPKDLSPENVERIIAHFAPTLFRRTVPAETVKRYRAHFERLAQTLPPEEAFKSTLITMMVSPQFLYRLEPPDRLDGFALASRLSYFLWRSTPDATLLQKAAAGQLENPKLLRAEVERMLADPKSDRFVRDFTGQWLRVNDLGKMRPDANLYPEYDPELEAAFREETVGFIREMFRSDLPLENLIDSNWTMLNQRLAKHYGIPGVTGSEFRKVVLDRAKTVRGGILTQGSIHAITSNGTVTSPIIRGVWVLENFLGTPPPPPPPNVDPIEPDIRGATNIRDQLKKHRDVPACASCHARIDPVGLALENFDVIGGWRDKYRALTPVEGRARPQITDGPAVDPSARVETAGEFKTFPEFRAIILQRKDLVFNNVGEKLTKFALGRPVDFADRDDVAEIVRTATSRNAGIRTMVLALVESPVFRKP